MAKSNPLFVDSTLLHGDRIGTQFELSRILIYDEESVIVTITNHLGEVHHVVMKSTDDGAYQAKVWLSHQKMITYRFSVERGGRSLFESREYKARAQYALLEDWQPIDEPAVLTENPSPAPALPVAVRDTPPPALNYTRSVASLIEKWGL